MLRRIVSASVLILVASSAADAGYVDLVKNDPGLVAYWQFENDTFEGGSQATDSSGNGYHGFYPDDEGVTASDDAIFGTSAYFNGDPFQVIEIEEEEPFDFTDTMTVEAWFKVDEFFDKNWQAIVNKGDDQWRLHRRGGECGLAFGRDENGTNNKDTVPMDDCVEESGEWHQAVAVYNNTEDGEFPFSALLYLDGELVADGPDEEVLGPLNTEEGANVDLPVMIGGNAQDGNHYRSFLGWIDEVSIYDRALSSAEIKEHFDAPKTEDGNVGGLAGDFNDNGVRDVGDLDLLAAAASDDASFDLTDDGIVNDADRKQWVEVLTNTHFGDSNFDGEFSSADFVTVFGAAKYEKGTPATWAEGDWNGDGVFNSSDFVAAFSGGGYEMGPRDGGLQTVPEPSSMSLLVLAMLGMVGVIRSRR